MYHKGYGPTIVTLEKYMRNLFSDLYQSPMQEGYPRVKPQPTEDGDGTGR